MKRKPSPSRARKRAHAPRRTPRRHAHAARPATRPRESKRSRAHHASRPLAPVPRRSPGLSSNVKLVVAFAVTFLAAGIGSYFTLPSIASWYATLAKPWFSPPDWVFGPVWTVLYVLMAYAAFLVWKNETPANARATRVALAWYLIQLGLNASWSAVFFAWHNVRLALFVLDALWVALALTMIRFRPLNKATSWLLAPYLLWVTFAGILNYYLWVLNP